MRVTMPALKEYKRTGRRFTMMTAYDHQTAQILDEAGVPVLLVGDTLGIFFEGMPTTVGVSMDTMVHHCRAVSTAAKSALVVGDLPFGSYQESVRQAVGNAVRLVQQGGAQAVKLEGPRPEEVAAIAGAGIPVIGHLGLTPQSVHVQGRSRVQARTATAVERLVDDARALAKAGASALVLEAVPTEAGRLVTEALEVPTIGIGAGPHCDAQVLVTTEILGLSAGPRPRFAKLYADLRGEISDVARTVVAEVETGRYPAPEHSYDWDIVAS
ncbi:3-methyl-2-oxobutanoate hydroxymethyltransferase [Actinocorallia herbida]|uniref:3-methyl-2-oxobutanoate hydroxymethyltransferase n=1 Tax=Actinocorallia herbida TaxID=58109 RepID=A0A3N1CY55_9ACTN|nr:3-methyl-2-oxobutanoate hydroxymethyltransferase [Actinocorallia herbida]ROO86214.1 3-methyl-2-oxobutanoate hydroxymethyltransferase [Actinocorallia herbida]